jgi:membrane protein DedA with SNARE-associated domain
MLDFLLDAVGSGPLTYLALIGIVTVDDFVPFAPGDTAMISAGIIAANGGLEIYLVVLAGAIGGFLGDNVSYWLGHRFGPRLADRFIRDGRGRELYDAARGQLAERGPTIVIVGRFIPGGRAVTTFAAGTVGYPYGRFVVVDSIAALAWATYTAMLGFVVGSSMRDAFWEPLLIGLGVALVLGAGAELQRRRSGEPGSLGTSPRSE